MSMRGKIKSIYPEGMSTVYVYLCDGEDGGFSVPVEHRYHSVILEHEDRIIGREIEYNDNIDPPVICFLD